MYKFIVFISLVLIAATSHARGTYQPPVEFITQVFQGQAPKPQSLWLTGELKPAVRNIMGHDLASLRLRYWGEPGRTVWVLEEIGKEKPITFGVVIHQNRIEQIKVLAFRESRGDEIRYPFFTKQFDHLGLNSDQRLSGVVDGISGATLSVRAMKKIARLALFLHQHSKYADASS